jgi:hypothetical protein
MEEIEYNIDNYTNDDLLKLFSLNNHDNITEKMVFDVTNHIYQKCKMKIMKIWHFSLKQHRINF